MYRTRKVDTLAHSTDTDTAATVCIYSNELETFPSFFFYVCDTNHQKRRLKKKNSFNGQEKIPEANRMYGLDARVRGWMQNGPRPKSIYVGTGKKDENKNWKR